MNHSKGELTKEDGCPINQITRLRIIAGLSQAQLAKAADINVMMISRLERGERSMEKTTLETAIKLADALEISDLRDLI